MASFAEVKQSMTLMFREEDYVANVTDTTTAGPFAPATMQKFDKRVEGDLNVGDPMPNVSVFVPSPAGDGDGGGSTAEPAAKRAKTGNGASASSGGGGGGGGGGGDPAGTMVPLASLRTDGRPLVLTFGSFS